MRIKTVTVIGATGTMGANVAGIFASFGNAKVFLIGRNIDKVIKTIPRIIESVRGDSIAKNLIPADFSMLEECVSASDLVFESVAENFSIKSEIAVRVGKCLKKNAVSCTGTSGLSVTALAECYPENLRGHFLGMHMFNPPYRMSLCELVKTGYTDKNIICRLKSYLQEKLYRTVVEVEDFPAFLGNRIGFQFINEALQYAERYRDNGGIDYIDAILGPFTGRSMAPLITSDFVGLDVHMAITDNIYKNTKDYAHDTFLTPDFLKKLISKGKLGRKSVGGLYKLVKYDNGLKKQMVWDIETETYRDQIRYAFPFAEKMQKFIAEGNYTEAIKTLIVNRSLEAEISLSFLLKYIVYSFYVAKKISYGVGAADDVMATGFHWCPPIALYQAISIITDVKALIHERISNQIDVDIDALFCNIKSSKYDYRLYFKATR